MGPHVVKELQAKNYEVFCINRSGYHPYGGQAYKWDRDSSDDLGIILNDHADFVLIDMIPFTAVHAGNLILALNGKQVKMIAVSSIDVYAAYNVLHNLSEKIQNVPLLEDSELRDRLSFQGAKYDKLNIEKIYWSYFDQCSILRMPAIYGLPDKRRIEDIFTELYQTRKISIKKEYAEWRFSRSSNVNCAYAISLCVDHESKEIFNVSEKYSYSELEWRLIIAKAMGIIPDIDYNDNVPIPYNCNVKQHWVVDSSKIRNRLGYYEKYDTEKTILDVVNSFLLRRSQH